MRKEIQIADDDAIETKVRRIGDQIHNLGCDHQNDEALSDELGSIASMCWEYGKEIAAQFAALKKENKDLRHAVGVSGDCIRALKEENERLMRIHADTCIKAGDEITTLKARVAELKKQNARLRSTGSPMANAFYNIAQGRSITPQMCADLYKDWDIAVKVEEPANEG